MSYASAFRRVAGDVALRITDSGYRHRQAELARLRSLPRYQPTVSNLIGIPLEIVDVHSFLAMYHEMYEQQAYRFQAKTEVPFIIDGGAWITNYVYMRSVFRKRGDMTLRIL